MHHTAYRTQSEATPEHGREGQSLSSTVPGASKGMVGLQGTLLIHIQLAVKQNLQTPFHKAIFQPLINGFLLQG